MSTQPWTLWVAAQLPEDRDDGDEPDDEAEFRCDRCSLPTPVAEMYRGYADQYVCWSCHTALGLSS